MLYHPDKHRDPELKSQAERLFNLVHQAYEGQCRPGSRQSILRALICRGEQKRVLGGVEKRWLVWAFLLTGSFEREGFALEINMCPVGRRRALRGGHPAGGSCRGNSIFRSSTS